MGIAYNQQKCQHRCAVNARDNISVSVLSNETRNLKYTFKNIAFR